MWKVCYTNWAIPEEIQFNKGHTKLGYLSFGFLYMVINCWIGNNHSVVLWIGESLYPENLWAHGRGLFQASSPSLWWPQVPPGAECARGKFQFIKSNHCRDLIKWIAWDSEVFLLPEFTGSLSVGHLQWEIPLKGRTAISHTGIHTS